MKSLTLTGQGLTLSMIEEFLEGKVRVRLAKHVRPRLAKVRVFVEKKLRSREPYYGINTGFGRLATQKIAEEDALLLQENLILSHAVGVGEPFPVPIARLIMLLRANVLAQGYSGIRPETLDLLVGLLNHEMTPIIPMQGSVGASGDLAPLAHIALTMIGRGLVSVKGQVRATRAAFKQKNLRPLTLTAKEGIALINGTQAMAAVAAVVLLTAQNLLKVADILGALSLEGDRASRRPFDARIHRLRPHPGQIATAANIRRLIQGSEIIAGHAHCTRVQDPYSFRCIPQVHGAVKDAFNFSYKTLTRELSSCTDNPLLFPRDDEILSGGNFHGEPLAFAMDFMAIALAELGSISERRVAILNSPLEGELPVSFLVPRPGINSGLMVPHVTMTALVSENKTLATPASVDSIPTSGGQEDHVSQGLLAARKALSIATNLEKILAIELLAACQAIDLQREGQRPGKGTGAVHDLVRKRVPLITRDREYRRDIEACLSLIQSKAIVGVAQEAVGPLKL